MRSWTGVASLLAGAALLAPSVAAAAPALTMELASDDRRRGLSWSDGRAALRATLDTPVGTAFRIAATAATLRAGPRHGGADAAIDLSAGWRDTAGPVQLDAGLIGHLFSGADGRQDYVEGQTGARLLIGPADIDLSATYAPSQHAIGGDNLHLAARTRVALIGTPFTLSAGLGHSSGDARDPVRARRLRPGGRYADWQLGADYVRNRLGVGIAYVGTNIGAADCGARAPGPRHCGDTVVARLNLTF